MDMTQEEIGLLRQLEQGRKTIPGNRQRGGLASLVNAGWIIERSLNLSDTEYEITDAGRAALAKSVGAAETGPSGSATGPRGKLWPR